MEGRTQSSKPSLTSKQREVIELMAKGLTNYEIANRLGLSLEGAKYHVSEVLARLDVATRQEAVVAWRRERNVAARARRVLSVLTPSGVWRGGALAAGGAAAVVLVFAGVARDGSQQPRTEETPLGAVVATIPVAEQPDSIAVGEGGVWVGHHTARVVTRIDPATNKVVTTIPVDTRWTDVTVGFGSAWALGSDAILRRIDPASNTVSSSLPLYDSPQGETSGMQVIAADGSVWAKDERGTVLRIDPTTNSVSARIHIASDSTLADIAAHGDYVWVVTGLGELHRVDVRDNSLELNVYRLPNPNGGIGLAASADGLWVTVNHSLGRIDPVSGGFIEIARLSQPGRPLVAFGSVWVGAAGQTVLARLPVNSGPGTSPPAIDVEGRVLGLAAGDGSVWFSGAINDTVVRIDPSLDGPGSDDDYVSTPTPESPPSGKVLAFP